MLCKVHINLSLWQLWWDNSLHVFFALILYEVFGGLHVPNSLAIEKGLAVPTSTGSSLDPAQNVLERRKISFPCRKSNHHYSFFWYIAPLLYRLSNPGSWISSYSSIKIHWQSKELWRISTVHMVTNLRSIKKIVTWTLLF